MREGWMSGRHLGELVGGKNREFERPPVRVNRPPLKSPQVPKVNFLTTRAGAPFLEGLVALRESA